MTNTPKNLSGRVAVVAGGTRGAGRGIAVELGAAGATVYVTGRTTSGEPSPMARRETIDETARLVDEAGGTGIPVRVDHADTEQVRALIERISDGHGRLDLLVNDIWGGDPLTEWDTPFWQHDLANGIALLRNAVETHLITSWHAAPLLASTPGSMIVEITDGVSDRYRGSLFYDLAKSAVIRLAVAQAEDLRPHGVTRRRVDPRVPAIRGHARALRRPRGQLARRDRQGPQLRVLRDTPLHRPRRRLPRRRPPQTPAHRHRHRHLGAHQGLQVQRRRRDTAQLGPAGTRPRRVAMTTVASLATGLAGSEWQLVAARAAQGVGAAMVSPTARPPQHRRFGTCEWTRH